MSSYLSRDCLQKLSVKLIGKETSSGMRCPSVYERLRCSVNVERLKTLMPNSSDDSREALSEFNCTCRGIVSVLILIGDHLSRIHYTSNTMRQVALHMHRLIDQLVIVSSRGCAMGLAPSTRGFTKTTIKPRLSRAQLINAVVAWIGVTQFGVGK